MATATLTVSISTSSNMGEKQHQERAELRHLLDLVSQAVGDGKSTSGTIRNRSGQSAGTWTYTPGAAN
ncbi:hypothetical protein BRAS3843_1730018 [Bradyrhizobium sp. STM 3843]|uniref:hypothetical protein n=1 Tax=Bradyrhizobium sp. STM 3843 TaxID=551947 RepID=UPI0002407123|nr:hypothetical protein [Bradyrhizobium sp. STM 3843]CCE06449.1 hypothetical protein BRAS3843_1730018 [Bradyrhizobium sp. STM 3843]